MKRWELLSLDNYNGPLDLLLTMVKEKRMDILDLDLLSISNQYISYINDILDLDLEVASEYLTMTAYLLELKSKLLIPKEEIILDENFEQSEREALVKRLMEYHKFKEVVEVFREKQASSIKMLSKEKSFVAASKFKLTQEAIIPPHLNLEKFSQLFLKIIEKNSMWHPTEHTVTSNHISQELISKHILSIINSNTKKEWQLVELLNETSILNIVATFVSILSLVSHQEIRLNIVDDNIYITKNEVN